MKIEEAIVYVLASSNRGMRTEQIADAINAKGLFHRKGGGLVDSKSLCGHHVPSRDLRQIRRTDPAADLTSYIIRWKSTPKACR